MKTLRIAVVVLACAAALAAAAQTAAFDVANPSLVGLSVNVEAGWTSGGYYEYRYILANGAPSTGALQIFAVDVTQLPGYVPGALPASGGSGRFFGNLSKVPIEPVGLLIPLNWSGAVTLSGLARWAVVPAILGGPEGQMAPGRVSPPLGLRSYDPPGLRKFSSHPIWHASDPNVTVTSNQVTLRGQTLGPVPISQQEIDSLFRGGSNNPAVVDLFLTYRIPSEKVTTLAAGQKATVVVHFGDTTIPATFKAIWNRTDVTSRFTPVPGKFGAVTLDPQPGRNVLVLSITGVKPGGGTATDSDHLIWEAP